MRSQDKKHSKKNEKASKPEKASPKTKTKTKTQMVADRRNAARIKAALGYARVKAKWVDLESRMHWPLKDVKYGGNRIVTADGCEIIYDSLADCALLEGEDRRDMVLLREGIVGGHYMTFRKTETGVVCEDGNHKLKVYREDL